MLAIRDARINVPTCVTRHGHGSVSPQAAESQLSSGKRNGRLPVKSGPA